MRIYTIDDLGRSATLDEHKEHLLDMMVEFDKFCKEHGLTYYLSGGTLLGAIRHKGFIPWDDDVDVNMPRPDCEKLMELSGGKIGKYVLNPPNFSKQYHAYHWKLYDESILVCKVAREVITKTSPIFMDIFPIEGLPDTEEGNIEHFNKIIKKKEQADTLWDMNLYRGGNPIKRKQINGTVFKNEREGREKLFNDVVAIQKTYSYDESEYVGVMATNVHTVEERVLKSEYSPVIEVEFEGHMFPAPKGYDTYLRQLYGKNYMKLPPIYSRVSRHGLLPFFKKDTREYAIDRFDWNKWHEYWQTGDKQIKIAICGLVKSENIGELFIARSLEYLIGTELRKKDPDIGIDFVEVDLLGRNDEIEDIPNAFFKRVNNYSYYYRKGEALDKVFQELKKHANEMDNTMLGNSIHRIRHGIWKSGLNYRKRLETFFNEKLEGVDFIVIDGAGLLEYSYNEYEWPLMLISKYAEKHGLSVVYNAIGRAGDFDENDFRSNILKRALQSSQVKYVSARDSVETVQACAGSKHKVKLLADAAFWMKETYKIEDNPNRTKIGIGLIRGTSLTGYGDDFEGDSWVKLFVNIAKELEKRGYDYEFFTNGLPADIALGREVLSKMALDNDKMVIRPVDDVELYNTINDYKAMITCRMHSAIAAFTLKIPSVILSWNDKVNKLMEIVGYPDRAINKESFDAKLIVDAMEKAMKEGVSDKPLDNMKAKSLESVTDYIDFIYDKVNEINK